MKKRERKKIYIHMSLGNPYRDFTIKYVFLYKSMIWSMYDWYNTLVSYQNFIQFSYNGFSIGRIIESFKIWKMKIEERMYSKKKFWKKL